MRVLLLSDDPDVRSALQSSGHDLLEDGEADPDVCVVHANSIESAQPDTPLIVISPDGFNLPRNVAAVLQKPLREGDLAAALQIAAHRRSDSAEQRRLLSAVERFREELNQFAFTVSHDTKEPIRTVKSYAELLQRRYRNRFDSDADEFIDFVVQGANRLEQLINDLLAYSQAGREDRTKPERTDAGAILQWAIMNVDRELKEAGGKLTNDPLPVVEVDRNQLALLFQHLIRNAIKFRGTAEPQIHVSGKRLNGMCEFSVRDNCIGIDPQFHERIFGVFKRLHGRDVPGTGIGLAICRKIVEAHGGQMWVDSALGRGSTFCFTLPAYD